MKSIQHSNKRHPNRSATITTSTEGRKTVTQTNRQVGNQFKLESERGGSTRFTIELANGTKVFLSGHDVRGIRSLIERHDAAKAGGETIARDSYEFGYYGY